MLGGLESRGPFVGSFSRHPGLLAGPGLRAAAAPLAPSPSAWWRATRALPTKNAWAARSSLCSLNAAAPPRCPEEGATGESGSARDGISSFGQGREGK